jgi:anti-sigma factor RsiW
MTNTMTCTQFRDALDCYLDYELAPGATSAAEQHRAGCPACDRLAGSARELKDSVRRAVAAIQVPEGLEARVRQAAAPRWSRPRAWLPPAAAAVILTVLAGGVMRGRGQPTRWTNSRFGSTAAVK